MSSTPIRKVKVTINNKTYLVEIGDLSTSPITVTVNGHSYLVNVETVPLKESLTEEGVEVLKKVVPGTLRPEKTPAPAPNGSTTGVVRAPMPGSIVEIFVKPGDKVSYRQKLCLLEAMKMNNVIYSPRDGVIATVEVTKGKEVAYGEVLFTFE